MDQYLTQVPDLSYADRTDLLFSLQKEHDTTLVLVTHDESVASRCHRSIQMIDGRIMEMSGTSGE